MSRIFVSISVAGSQIQFVLLISNQSPIVITIGVLAEAVDQEPENASAFSYSWRS
jgi:hypothetical protein